MDVTDIPSDSELVALMASGDREAFATLFRRHRGTVYRFSRQMLGTQEAAEDVTQDVFIVFARHAHRFNPSVGLLSTYLYGIARNLIWQRHKRNRTHLEVDIDAIDAERTAAFAMAADPADELSRTQMVEQLRLAILRLPVHYREVVVLCELNGLSYEAAAAVAGCPVGTIRSRLSRARRMLIEKCRTLLAGKHPVREEDRGQREESRKKWLILTKNNC
jgi:RNA polymerase sigma-70 factor, ECF subfamily